MYGPYNEPLHIYFAHIYNFAHIYKDKNENVYKLTKIGLE
jgi:hypothetical protein